MKEFPQLVQRLTDAVSYQLRRPAYCRKVLNRDEWFVNDPVFSFVQHGMKKGNTGYRVGYHINFSEETVLFTLVHSPIIARLFKQNLVFDSMLAVLQSTKVYRNYHFVYRSSKQALLHGNDGKRIESESLEEFLILLKNFDVEHGFVQDLFPRRENTGKGQGNAPVAGNTFYLLLANNFEQLATRDDVAQLVAASWPLFLCLYPIKAIEKRSANLARNMKISGIPQVCEFNSIQLPEECTIDPLCRGKVQGAHIKPNALGGSDQPENGIWLCEYHHQATEGKLSGRRNAMGLDVKFVPT
ncbi:MAG: HNH endonuclease [Anaerolineae bacterium]|nr:HNH endonuclease [Anaerolineae bacterium]